MAYEGVGDNRASGRYPAFVDYPWEQALKNGIGLQYHMVAKE